MSILDERIRRRKARERECFDRFREELLSDGTEVLAKRRWVGSCSWERAIDLGLDGVPGYRNAARVDLEAALAAIDPDPLDTAEGQGRR